MSDGSEALPLPPHLKMAPEKPVALQMQGSRYHSTGGTPSATITHNLDHMPQTPTETPLNNTLILPVESWNRRASESAASDRPRVPPGRIAGARCPRLRPKLARLRYMALSRISVSCSKHQQYHCHCHPMVLPPLPYRSPSIIVVMAGTSCSYSFLFP